MRKMLARKDKVRDTVNKNPDIKAGCKLLEVDCRIVYSLL